jgi:ABC-2 type transport system permease protein
MRKYWKTSLRDTAEIFTEELKNVFRDSGIILIFFAACLIYPVLYGFIYKAEVYRNMSIVVVNESHSPLSREFVRKLDATPELKVTYKVNTMAEAEKLFAQNKVYGVVNIPSSFANDLAAGRQTKVLAYSSMASMMYYKAFYAGFNYVCLDVDKRIQTSNLTLKGSTIKQAETISEPILFEGKALYNPYGGFPSFLLPAVLILILQQTLVLGIGMLAGTAREENRFHNLIPYQRKYHGTMRIIWGKAMAYLVLYLFIGMYDLVLMPYLFGLPHNLSLWSVMPFLTPYLLACIFFGMAISVFWWNREMPLLLFLCTSVPLLFISGFSWPSSHIHPFWKIISYFFPSTFGINGFLKLNSMGASLGQVAPEIMALWVQAGFYFVFAWFVYYWQISQGEKKITE